MQTLRIPFQIDSRGGLAVVEDTVSIISQQIIDLLTTAHYERPMNPAYGAGVPEFLFRPVLPALLSTRASEIKTYLNSIVQLAVIQTVSLSQIPGPESTLSLDVKFTVVPSSRVFSVTTTVTGLVTDETFDSGSIL